MKKLISTIVVDDELACIQTLVKDLSRYQELNIVETTTSAEKAQKIIIKEQPDLLFLDMEMPGMSGMELLNNIRGLVHSELYVVFYSAYDKYIIEALRASAFDFLLKPYSIEELDGIIARVKNDIALGKVNFEQSMRRLLSDDRKIAIQTVTGITLLRRSDILYFQYDGACRSWQMIMKDNKNIQRLRSGGITSKELLNISTSFMQVSQDVILNMDYLMFIENKTFRCVLVPPFSDVDIKVSRRYYSKIKEVLEIL